MASVLVVLDAPPALSLGTVWPVDSHLSTHADLDVLLSGGALFLVAPGPSKTLLLVAVVELPRKRPRGWFGEPNVVPIQDLTAVSTELRLGVRALLDQRGPKASRARVLEPTKALALRRACGAAAPEEAREPLDVFELPGIREARAADPDDPLAGKDLVPWKAIATRRKGGGATLPGMLSHIAGGGEWPPDEGPKRDISTCSPAMAFVTPFLVAALPQLAEAEWTFTVLLGLGGYLRAPVPHAADYDPDHFQPCAVVDDPNVARDLERSVRKAMTDRSDTFIRLLDSAEGSVRSEAFKVLMDLGNLTWSRRESVGRDHLHALRAYLRREPDPSLASLALDELVEHDEREPDPATDAFLDDLVTRRAACAAEAAHHLVKRALSRGPAAEVQTRWIEAIALGHATGSAMIDVAPLLAQLAMRLPSDRLLAACIPALAVSEDPWRTWEIVKGLVCVAFQRRLTAVPADPSHPFITRDPETGALDTGTSASHCSDDPVFEAEDGTAISPPQKRARSKAQAKLLATSSNLAAPVTSSSLDTHERQVLEAMVACDHVWLVRSDYLSVFGLPRLRHEVAALVGVVLEAPPEDPDPMEGILRLRRRLRLLSLSFAKDPSAAAPVPSGFPDTLYSEEVRDQERAFGVRLPRQYSSYLVHVAEGGPSPGGDLLRLQDALHDGSRHPFPGERGTVEGAAVPGAIALCAEKDGVSWWLAVQGSSRGTVWSCRGSRLAPNRTASSAACTFVEWMEAWVERLERERGIDSSPDLPHPAGEGNVRALVRAIAKAPAGGTITIRPGRYVLTEPLDFTKALTVCGSGVELVTPPETTGIDVGADIVLRDLTIRFPPRFDIPLPAPTGAARCRDFAAIRVHPWGPSLTLSGCTILGAREDHNVTGIRAQGRKVSLESTRIEGFMIGIQAAFKCDTRLRGVEITGCSDGLHGLSSATLRVVRSRFIRNVRGLNADTLSMVKVSDCDFVDNAEIGLKIVSPLHAVENNRFVRSGNPGFELA